MFLRLANEHREFVKDLVMSLQALATVLERRGYEAACYTCGDQMNSANFMVSLTENHLIRFLVSDYGITWTELRDDRANPRRPDCHVEMEAAVFFELERVAAWGERARQGHAEKRPAANEQPQTPRFDDRRQSERERPEAFADEPFPAAASLPLSRTHAAAGEGARPGFDAVLLVETDAG